MQAGPGRVGRRAAIDDVLHRVGDRLPGDGDDAGDVVRGGGDAVRRGRRFGVGRDDGNRVAELGPLGRVVPVPRVTQQVARCDAVEVTVAGLQVGIRVRVEVGVLLVRACLARRCVGGHGDDGPVLAPFYVDPPEGAEGRGGAVHVVAAHPHVGRARAGGQVPAEEDFGVGFAVPLGPDPVGGPHEMLIDDFDFGEASGLGERRQLPVFDRDLAEGFAALRGDGLHPIGVGLPQGDVGVQVSQTADEGHRVLLVGQGEFQHGVFVQEGVQVGDGGYRVGALQPVPQV